jgi:hypothetical protein
MTAGEWLVPVSAQSTMERELRDSRRAAHFYVGGVVGIAACGWRPLGWGITRDDDTDALAEWVMVQTWRAPEAEVLCKKCRAIVDNPPRPRP